MYYALPVAHLWYVDCANLGIREDNVSTRIPRFAQATATDSLINGGYKIRVMKLELTWNPSQNPFCSRIFVAMYSALLVAHLSAVALAIFRI